MIYINVTTWLDTEKFNSSEAYVEITEVANWVIITIGLILMPIAIFALCSLVKKDNVAPIYVINLLICDVIQLCSIILRKTGAAWSILDYMHLSGLMVSVGFMVCIALERYLAIVWPLWYRIRRTVKMSLVVCAVVWTLALLMCLVDFWEAFPYMTNILICIYLLIPFPLLIFFLVGTFKALSASVSVRAEEKRRIVGLLVLVLLIYTLLFLPRIIFKMVQDSKDLNVDFMSMILVKLNPLADLFLYIFLKKGAVKFLLCLCCCRKNRTSRQSSSGLNDGNTVTSV